MSLSRAQLLHQAFGAGYDAALTRGREANPYVRSSDEWDEWESGYATRLAEFTE